MKTKYDYTKLRQRIKEVYGTQKRLADALRISEKCMSMKLNSKTYFKVSQLLVLIQLLNIDETEIEDFFFTVEGTV